MYLSERNTLRRTQNYLPRILAKNAKSETGYEELSDKSKLREIL